MSPKVLAAGNHKLVNELVKLIKEADTKTLEKKFRNEIKNININTC